MEFTTRFGLHSQATRLREAPGPARRGAATGLTPSAGCGLDHKDLGPPRAPPGRGASRVATSDLRSQARKSCGAPSAAAGGPRLRRALDGRHTARAPLLPAPELRREGQRGEANGEAPSRRREPKGERRRRPPPDRAARPGSRARAAAGRERETARGAAALLRRDGRREGGGTDERAGATGRGWPPRPRAPPRARAAARHGTPAVPTRRQPPARGGEKPGGEARAPPPRRGHASRVSRLSRLSRRFRAASRFSLSFLFPGRRPATRTGRAAPGPRTNSAPAGALRERGASERFPESAFRGTKALARRDATGTSRRPRQTGLRGDPSRAAAGVRGGEKKRGRARGGAGSARAEPPPFRSGEGAPPSPERPYEHTEEEKKIEREKPPAERSEGRQRRGSARSRPTPPARGDAAHIERRPSEAAQAPGLGPASARRDRAGAPAGRVAEESRPEPARPLSRRGTTTRAAVGGRRRPLREAGGSGRPRGRPRARAAVSPPRPGRGEGGAGRPSPARRGRPRAGDDPPGDGDRERARSAGAGHHRRGSAGATPYPSVAPRPPAGARPPPPPPREPPPRRSRAEPPESLNLRPASAAPRTAGFAAHPRNPARPPAAFDDAGEVFSRGAGGKAGRPGSPGPPRRGALGTWPWGEGNDLDGPAGVPPPLPPSGERPPAGARPTSAATAAASRSGPGVSLSSPALRPRGPPRLGPPRRRGAGGAAAESLARPRNARSAPDPSPFPRREARRPLGTRGGGDFRRARRGGRTEKEGARAPPGRGRAGHPSLPRPRGGRRGGRGDESRGARENSGRGRRSAAPAARDAARTRLGAGRLSRSPAGTDRRRTGAGRSPPRPSLLRLLPARTPGRDARSNAGRNPARAHGGRTRLSGESRRERPRRLSRGAPRAPLSLSGDCARGAAEKACGCVPRRRPLLSEGRAGRREPSVRKGAGPAAWRETPLAAGRTARHAGRRRPPDFGFPEAARRVMGITPPDRQSASFMVGTTTPPTLGGAAETAAPHRAGDGAPRTPPAFPRGPRPANPDRPGSFTGSDPRERHRGRDGGGMAATGAPGSERGAEARPARRRALARGTAAPGAGNGAPLGANARPPSPRRPNPGGRPLPAPPRARSREPLRSFFWLCRFSPLLGRDASLLRRPFFSAFVLSRGHAPFRELASASRALRAYRTRGARDAARPGLTRPRSRRAPPAGRGRDRPPASRAAARAPRAAGTHGRDPAPRPAPAPRAVFSEGTPEGSRGHAAVTQPGTREPRKSRPAGGPLRRDPRSLIDRSRKKGEAKLSKEERERPPEERRGPRGHGPGTTGEALGEAAAAGGPPSRVSDGSRQSAGGAATRPAGARRFRALPARRGAGRGRPRSPRGRTPFRRSKKSAAADRALGATGFRPPRGGRLSPSGKAGGGTAKEKKAHRASRRPRASHGGPRATAGRSARPAPLAPHLPAGFSVSLLSRLRSLSRARAPGSRAPLSVPRLRAAGKNKIRKTGAGAPPAAPARRRAGPSRKPGPPFAGDHGGRGGPDEHGPPGRSGLFRPRFCAEPTGGRARRRRLARNTPGKGGSLSGFSGPRWGRGARPPLRPGRRSRVVGAPLARGPPRLRAEEGGTTTRRDGGDGAAANPALPRRAVGRLPSPSPWGDRPRPRRGNDDPAELPPRHFRHMWDARRERGRAGRRHPHLSQPGPSWRALGERAAGGRTQSLTGLPPRATESPRPACARARGRRPPHGTDGRKNGGPDERARPRLKAGRQKDEAPPPRRRQPVSPPFSVLSPPALFSRSAGPRPLPAKAAAAGPGAGRGKSGPSHATRPGGLLALRLACRRTAGAVAPLWAFDTFERSGSPRRRPCTTAPIYGKREAAKNSDPLVYFRTGADNRSTRLSGRNSPKSRRSRVDLLSRRPGGASEPSRRARAKAGGRARGPEPGAGRAKPTCPGKGRRPRPGPGARSRVDLVSGRSRVDLVSGRSRVDLVSGRSRVDLVSARSRVDLVSGRSRVDLVSGRSRRAKPTCPGKGRRPRPGPGARSRVDLVSGRSRVDLVSARSRVDLVSGRSRVDLVSAGAGPAAAPGPGARSRVDLVSGRSRVDLVSARSRVDLVSGRSRVDLVSGRSRVDLVSARSRVDLVSGRSR
ncbi:collagen alpha-1(II) chain-like, partial [Saccopteryx bilineata]|uniref:collagen alpha-1(II) chain-like n=1 Tax=Saccopteryx bilineata TaxID=59482 RepID=UPI00338F05F9